MTMARIVDAEMLDGLDAGHPAARRSRRDLQRIHRVMGTRSILLRAWRGLVPAHPASEPLRVLELGAGDGTLMLGVARALARRGPPDERRRVEFTLLDRADLLKAQTVQGYRAAGWVVAAQVCDVNEWVAAHKDGIAAPGARRRWNVIVANLFLHHFDDAHLRALLVAVASRTDVFLACEPRRGRLALAASHCVGAIGANAVTRTDSVLSVRAGFCGAEIAACWPQEGRRWSLREYPAGLFSHCFGARAEGE